MKFLFYFCTLGVFFSPLMTYAVGMDSYDVIRDTYKRGEKIRILLVPGHDNEFSGASFNGVREADINLEMAEILGSFLSQDPKIKITLSRDEQGYNSHFLEYFNANKEKILSDVRDKKISLEQKIASNEITISDQVSHADAADQVIERLYGLNSWIDSEGFDLVLHVHFNDYGSHDSDSQGGKYSGFSIYTPSQELLNATTSKILGDAIGQHLIRTLYRSNLPEEEILSNSYGVIPDFYLIAMGAYETVKTPRVLLEYSYIYEPQIEKDFFTVTALTLAKATTLGVHDFLVNKKVSQQKNLEYNWQNKLEVSKLPKVDVLALQYALSELGFFPIKNKSREECPFSGVFGSCTKKALQAFQAKYSITKTGYAGPSTRRVLNRIFG